MFWGILGSWARCMEDARWIHAQRLAVSGGITEA